MTKSEWQVFHGFTDEEMNVIELALSISNGKITDIFNEPLKYQDIKIVFDKNRKLNYTSTQKG